MNNIALLLTLAFVSTDSASLLQCVTGCWRNNVFYQNGDQVPSLDSCNTCWCTRNLIVCTKIYCPPEAPEESLEIPEFLPVTPGCTQNGINYQDGDEVPSLDSCNTCFCFGSAIVCTLIYCP
ncbi:CLUMA_CG005520, isoform A, partial [Clunio marinus]